MVICTNLSNESLKDFGSIIQDELNIKVLTWVTDLNELEEISFKLNFKVAGAIFGKNVNNVKKYVENLTATQKQLLLSKGSIPIVISNESYELLKEHVITETHVKEGYAFVEDGIYKVLINTKLTSELLEEGLIRDFIRIIQDTRKKYNYPIEKYINLSISCSEDSKSLIQRFEFLIKSNVLVHNIQFVSELVSESAIPVMLNNQEVTLNMQLE